MKSDKSNMWYIRITAPWEHIEIKYALMRDWIDYTESAIGYHMGVKTKKAHAHIAIKLSSELQKQSIDTRLKKLFDVKGSDYSSKLWDGHTKALSYLYHDKSGKVDIHMKLSEEKLLEIKNLVTVYDEIVTTAKNKASYKCVDCVLEAIKESGRLWTNYDIVRYILRGVRDCKWHPPGSYMDRYVDEIRIKQGSEEDSSGVIDAMCHQFLSRYEKIYS